MEGCCLSIVKRIRSISRREISELLRGESEKHEVSKTILNILWNIVYSKALVLSDKNKANFQRHSALLRELSSKKTAFASKRHLLIKNPAAVKVIAQACPLQKEA